MSRCRIHERRTRKMLDMSLHDDAPALPRCTVAFCPLGSCADGHSCRFCEHFGDAPVVLCRAFCTGSANPIIRKVGWDIPRYRLAFIRLATASPSSYTTGCCPCRPSFSAMAGSSRRSHLHATNTSCMSMIESMQACGRRMMQSIP